MMRSMLTAAMTAVVVTLSGLSADAGLFFNRGGNCGGCNTCAAPAPTCGGCEVSCRPRKVKRVKNNCCNAAPSCCAPTCCAPVAAPTCCAPAAAPSCCAPAASCCGAVVAPTCAAPAVGAPVAAPVEHVEPAPKKPAEAPKPPKEGGAQ